jgi:PAS domain S-box-containing protein
MFAKKALSQNTLHAMASVANGIALGIERKMMEDELRQSEERFRELAENIREIFYVAGPDGTPVYYVSPGFDEITRRSREAFKTNPRFWIDLIHPDDRGRVEQVHTAAPEELDTEYRIVRPDGSIRWLRSRSFPVHDANGQTVRSSVSRKTSRSENAPNRRSDGILNVSRLCMKSISPSLRL